MSLEDLIDDVGMECSITAESPDGRPPGQTAMGGADRSDAKWLAVVEGVACLLNIRSSDLDYNRNDQRANVVRGRIYFTSDPVPSGLSTRHRIVVTNGGIRGAALVGTYAVMGVVDPIDPQGPRVFQVDVERIRTP